MYRNAKTHTCTFVTHARHTEHQLHKSPCKLTQMWATTCGIDTRTCNAQTYTHISKMNTHADIFIHRDAHHFSMQIAMHKQMHTHLQWFTHTSHLLSFVDTHAAKHSTSQHITANVYLHMLCNCTHAFIHTKTQYSHAPDAKTNTSEYTWTTQIHTCKYMNIIPLISVWHMQMSSSYVH